MADKEYILELWANLKIKVLTREEFLLNEIKELKKINNQLQIKLDRPKLVRQKSINSFDFEVIKSKIRFKLDELEKEVMSRSPDDKTSGSLQIATLELEDLVYDLTFLPSDYNN